MQNLDRLSGDNMKLDKSEIVIYCVAKKEIANSNPYFSFTSFGNEFSKIKNPSKPILGKLSINSIILELKKTLF